MWLTPPSTNKTSAVYPLQPLHGHTPNSHLFDFCIWQTLKGFASHWVLNQAAGRLETDRTGRRDKGEQEWKSGWLGAERNASSLLLCHVETWPPAEPVKALHHVRHAETPSWVIWSLWGMRWPVTYKWEAAHADTCATRSHASKTISKKVGVILRMLASHAEDSPGCF